MSLWHHEPFYVANNARLMNYRLLRARLRKCLESVIRLSRDEEGAVDLA
jgi:hypothetical protein